MRAAAITSICFMLAACGGSTTIDPGGAGGSGASTSTSTSTSTGCPEQPFLCADDCGSDYFPAEAECVGGAWVCPPGTVNPADCPPGTCWGPPLACEVCTDAGWACQLEESCVAGCGGLVCAGCPAGPAPAVIGACACACDAAGQVSCALAPGCCEEDLQCGDAVWVPCVSHVCKDPVAGKCWVDGECAPGEVCVGASVCPCGFDCDGPDQPGDCLPQP